MRAAGRATAWWRAPLVGASACFVVACAADDGGAGPITPPLPPPPPAPAPVYDATAWVTTSDGTIPVVIVAPHLHPRAILIDLHGHSHAIPRIELGYHISAARLRLDDAGLLPHVANSSVAQLHRLKAAGDTGAMLFRGPRALGSRLAALGVPSVPSDVTPAPLVGEEYFSGGYNTERHGSRSGGAVDAIQLESHYTGVRDTAANRQAFAETLVTALLGLLDDYYDWTPPAP